MNITDFERKERPSLCGLVFSIRRLPRPTAGSAFVNLRCYVATHDGWSPHCGVLQPHVQPFTDQCTVKLPVCYLMCWLLCAVPHGQTALSYFGFLLKLNIFRKVNRLSLMKVELCMYASICSESRDDTRRWNQTHNIQVIPSF